jgi:hypothetical protein
MKTIFSTRVESEMEIDKISFPGSLRMHNAGVNTEACSALLSPRPSAFRPHEWATVFSVVANQSFDLEA